MGSICWYIVDVNVNVFQRPTGNAFYGHVPKDLAKLREWWEPRKEMSLADIQLDAITVTRKTHLTRRLSPMRGPATEDDRKKDIELLEKLAEQIKETGKPISVKAISRRETAFENYPWPPKK